MSDITIKYGSITAKGKTKKVVTGTINKPVIATAKRGTVNTSVRRAPVQIKGFTVNRPFGYIRQFAQIRDWWGWVDSDNERDWVDWKLVRDFTDVYDDAGNIIHDAEGRPVSRDITSLNEYNYDNNGKLLKDSDDTPVVVIKKAGKFLEDLPEQFFDSDYMFAGYIHSTYDDAHTNAEDIPENESFTDTSIEYVRRDKSLQLYNLPLSLQNNSLEDKTFAEAYYAEIKKFIGDPYLNLQFSRLQNNEISQNEYNNLLRNRKYFDDNGNLLPTVIEQLELSLNINASARQNAFYEAEYAARIEALRDYHLYDDTSSYFRDDYDEGVDYIASLIYKDSYLGSNITKCITTDIKFDDILIKNVIKPLESSIKFTENVTFTSKFVKVIEDTLRYIDSFGTIDAFDRISVSEDYSTVVSYNRIFVDSLSLSDVLTFFRDANFEDNAFKIQDPFSNTFTKVLDRRTIAEYAFEYSQDYASDTIHVPDWSISDGFKIVSNKSNIDSVRSSESGHFLIFNYLDTATYMPLDYVGGEVRSF